jgi:hypothetical protein
MTIASWFDRDGSRRLPDVLEIRTLGTVTACTTGRWRGRPKGVDARATQNHTPQSLFFLPATLRIARATRSIYIDPAMLPGAKSSTQASVPECIEGISSDSAMRGRIASPKRKWLSVVGWSLGALFAAATANADDTANCIQQAVARNNGWRLPARSSSNRRFSSSTRPPAVWTSLRPSTSARPSTNSRAG